MNNILSCMVLCISFTGCATVALPIAAAVGFQVSKDHSKKYLSDYEMQVSRMSCRQLAAEHTEQRKFNANPFLNSGDRYTLVQSRMKAKGCRIPKTAANTDFKTKFLSWAS
jgi:hypothetical protein